MTEESVVYARPTISLGAAQRLISSAFEVAGQDPTTSDAIACAVVGSSGELVAFAAHDGCGPLPRELAARKAYTAVILKRTTSAVKTAVSAGQIDLARLGDVDLVPMPGGAPLLLDGAVIGAVGVSGLPPEEDARVADQVVMRFSGVAA